MASNQRCRCSSGGLLERSVRCRDIRCGRVGQRVCETWVCGTSAGGVERSDERDGCAEGTEDAAGHRQAGVRSRSEAVVEWGAAIGQHQASWPWSLSVLTVESTVTSLAKPPMTIVRMPRTLNVLSRSEPKHPSQPALSTSRSSGNGVVVRRQPRVCRLGRNARPSRRARSAVEPWRSHMTVPPQARTAKARERMRSSTRGDVGTAQQSPFGHRRSAVPCASDRARRRTATGTERCRKHGRYSSVGPRRSGQLHADPTGM